MKNFEKTSRNRARSNFVIDIQQGDRSPITVVETVALLKGESNNLATLRARREARSKSRITLKGSETLPLT